MRLRSLLRYEADVPLGGLWVDPVLPEAWGSLHTTNLPVGGAWIKPDVSGSRVTVDGLAPGMAFHTGTRPQLVDLLDSQQLRLKE
jgi:hypothetical protein